MSFNSIHCVFVIVFMKFIEIKLLNSYCTKKAKGNVFILIIEHLNKHDIIETSFENEQKEYVQDNVMCIGEIVIKRKRSYNMIT